MSKHTPGPWEAAKRCNAVYAGAQCVANLTEVTTGVEAEEGRANALLVAAAPDLLAACKMLMGVAEWADRNRKRSIVDVCDWSRVRAAVAKAEGGAE